MYFVLENSQLKQSEEELKGRFYLKGHYEGLQFVAESSVLGDIPLASEGKPGWFELSSQHFYSQQTAQLPVSPYIIGYMTPEGFKPSKKNIY
ncbi:MAG: hypothetical protein I8H75_04765 [Myxococcaceae bacterium]|nr:hypothetical protein [Myxococcaceae bacterium]MBH2006636.1 hypothetical protein [Myxococcaceae bacterium]